MKQLAYELLKSEYPLKIFGMRIEKIKTFVGSVDIHIILLYLNNRNFELSFQESDFELKEVRNWLGYTHIANKSDIELNRNLYQLFMTQSTQNKYFIVTDGKISYNPDMFSKTNRVYKESPVLLFHGDSNTQKSYIGAILKNYSGMNVIETDSYVKEEDLISDLNYARVVVIGNKHSKFGLDFVKQHVNGELIDVRFKPV